MNLLQTGKYSSLFQKTKIYKNLQILAGLSNDCNQYRMFPSTALGTPIIAFFALYVAIRLHTSLSLIEVGFFAFIYFNVTVFYLTIFVSAANLYIKSVVVLILWKREMARMAMPANKTEKRILKAMQPLKIRFGINFVDNHTPLVVQDFSMRQMASLLLIL